jgi:hypothetical protein
MKAPLVARLAPRFSVVLVFAVLVGTAFSSQAWAQKKRVVVVEAFKGPAADKYRIAVMKSVYREGIDVIPDKQLIKVEADLGLQRVADSYSGIARELKLTGFVSGIITGGRRPKARIIVRNADGKPIGGQIFQATSAPKLIAMVSAGAGTKVSAVLGSTPGDAATNEAEAVAAATEEPAAAAEEPAEEESKGGDAEASEKESGSDDADADVAASADDDEDAPRKKKASGDKSLRAAFVMRMFSRNFAYNDNKVGGQQGYQAPETKFSNLPLVPAPGIALEFFPTSFLGVFGSYNRAIVGSKDSGGSVYSTSASQFTLGVKSHLDLGGIGIEPLVSYGGQSYAVSDLPTAPGRLQVAGVDYKTLGAGADARFALSGGASVFVGGRYLHILSAGEILSETYFQGSAVGGEFGAGVIYPLSFAKGFDLSVGLDLRRIAFAFTPDMTAPRIAGGAVDQYVGLNLGLGYNIGL